MKSSTVLFIIVTLILAAGVYWYVSTGTGNESPLTATGSQTSAQTQFQSLVSQLQPISFNTAIFEEPNFLALVDLTTPITPESSGRLDPFAPVSGVVVK